MQNTLNKSLIVTLLFMMSIGLNAQNFSANYTYDAKGNRLTASVTYLLKSAKLTADQKVNSTDTVVNCIIRVYPNPTHGDLVLEIVNITPEQLRLQRNAIEVVTLQGKTVLEIATVSSSNPVDLSDLASGTYVLKVQIGKEVRTYKIVKD